MGRAGGLQGSPDGAAGTREKQSFRTCLRAWWRCEIQGNGTRMDEVVDTPFVGSRIPPEDASAVIVGEHRPPPVRRPGRRQDGGAGGEPPGYLRSSPRCRAARCQSRTASMVNRW